MFNSPQRAILALLQDDTRNKILTILNDSPCHPDVLVEHIGVSRTAIEKHLKQLLAYGIIERRTQTVPRLRYIYSLTIPAQNLIEAISVASETFIDFTKENLDDQLLKTEQAFLFNIIPKEEYEQIKENIDEKLLNFDIEESEG